MSCLTMMARATGNRYISPGPAAYDIAGTVGKGTPKYSIKGRHEVPIKRMDPEYQSLPTDIGKGVKFTLASRHALHDTTPSPGPQYIPPPLGKETFKYSVGLKSKTTKNTSTEDPGPGQYNIPPYFSKGANAFTMKGRHSAKSEEPTPGPGQYVPNFEAIKSRAPSATLHKRTPLLPPEVTPAPGTYEVPRMLGNAPKFTFHIRPKDGSAYVTPGPDKYTPLDPIKEMCPKFTMKGRHPMKERPITAPYRDIPSLIGKAPRFSLKSRHDQKEATSTPGPSFIPPALGTEVPKRNISVKYPAERSTSISDPGPGAYEIHPIFGKEACRFTLKGRHQEIAEDTAHFPGPGTYDPKFDATLPRAPSSTLHIRPKGVQSVDAVGYVDLGSTLKGPRFTIGEKEKLDYVPV